jgi:F-type H+-transporting ATPase subunit epsilon
MTARKLVLEIVTPDGPALAEEAVDVVVFRRRERRFELGSEIAVFPLHAPMLVRMPVAPARYRKGGRTYHVVVGGGFAEVRRDRVLIVTSRCERVPAEEPDPAASARDLGRRWRREMRGFLEEMIGYP